MKYLVKFGGKTFRPAREAPNISGRISEQISAKKSETSFQISRLISETSFRRRAVLSYSVISHCLGIAQHCCLQQLDALLHELHHGLVHTLQLVLEREEGAIGSPNGRGGHRARILGAALSYEGFLAKCQHARCTPRGSCNNTLLRRVLRRFSNSKCFLEGFLEGTL